MERFEEALADADEALQLDPDNLKGKCRRGIALRELGHYSLALKEFGACLERETDSANFQQLYDQCQALADQKSFVNMALRIEGYKDPATSGSEQKLELVDGLLSFAQDAQSFRSLVHLQAHIKEHVKGAFGAIHIEDTVVDEEMMEFFRSLDPAVLASVYLEFFNVRCSGAHFAELFGGQLFRPTTVWFSGMDRTEIDLTTALSSLGAVRNAMSFQLRETSFDRFYDNTGGIAAPKKRNAQLDVDTVLGLLHEQHPDIPAHVRACPTFLGKCLPDGWHSVTANESISVFRRMAGRIIALDFDHVGDGGADGTLAEIIEKCTQRFQSARSPVSYMFNLLIPLLPTDHLNPADFATLSGIVHRDQFSVLYNGVGEQLTVGAVMEEFKDEKKSRGGRGGENQAMIPEGSRVATVFVLRVRGPSPPSLI